MGVEAKHGFIVFSDLKGFSKLEPEEQERYLKVHVHLLSQSIKPLLDRAFVSNTWGDAIIAVFEDGMDAADFMLNYRKEARKSMRPVSDKNVLPRIAGHFGLVNYFEDPLLNRNNTISNEVNTAARIEPVTRPGEIFVSEEFKDAFEQQTEEQSMVKFERLGRIPLAKGHGDKVLHRMIESDEKAHIIDRLINMGLPQALPKDPKIEGSEKEIIETLKKLTDRNQILACIEKERHAEHNGIFAFEIAKICKKAGLYQDGINWIELAQKEKVETDGIMLFPFRTKKDVIKLKADLLTRLGKYEESADILYSLWRNIEGEKTTDASEILSMLAAQFKRRALDNQDSMNDRDKELLKKAAGLYLEAFRHDIDNYYPAINAAYLLVMLGGKEAKNGKQLARYIKSTWKNEKGSSHWLDFTLAETEILQGDYDDAVVDIKAALKRHGDSLGIFDIETTKVQITQFLKIMQDEEEGRELIEILDHFMKDN
jgi:class 3 adenylate cyclase